MCETTRIGDIPCNVPFSFRYDGINSEYIYVKKKHNVSDKEIFITLQLPKVVSCGDKLFYNVEDYKHCYVVLRKDFSFFVKKARR